MIKQIAKLNNEIRKIENEFTKDIAENVSTHYSIESNKITNILLWRILKELQEIKEEKA